MRPLRQAHPRRWSEAPAGDLRCLRDGSRRDPPGRRPEEGATGGEGPGEGPRQGPGEGRQGARPRRRPRRRSRRRPRKRRRRRRPPRSRQPPPPAPRRRRPGPGAVRPALLRPRAAPRRAPEHVHDVVVVGAGPAGASCGYWLAEAGWDVVVVEKKEFPREKTCGDGLTPRAVRQLADMGLEGALSGSHRYDGLRAFGFGRSTRHALARAPELPRLRLHHHASRPRRAGRRARGGRRGDPPPGHGGDGPGRGRGHCVRRARSRPCAASRSRRRAAPAPARSAPATSWWPTGPTRGWAACWAPRGDGTCRWAWPCAATTAPTATTTPTSSHTSTSATPRATSSPGTAGSSPWATAG